jgi:hypothetical protein
MALSFNYDTVHRTCSGRDFIKTVSLLILHFYFKSTLLRKQLLDQPSHNQLQQQVQ